MTTKNSTTISNVAVEDEDNCDDDDDDCGDCVGGDTQKGAGLGEGSGDGDGDVSGEGDGLGEGDGVYVSRAVSSYARLCVLPQSHGSTSPLLEVSTSSFIYYTKRFYYCVKVCTENTYATTVYAIRKTNGSILSCSHKW